MGDSGSRIIRAYQMGVQLRMQREQMEEEKRTRGLDLKRRELALKLEKMNHQLGIRQAQQSAVGLAETQASPVVNQPNPAALMPGDPNAITPQPFQKRPIQLSAVTDPDSGAELVPSQSIIPRSQDEIIREALQKAMSHPTVLAKRMDVAADTAPATIPEGLPGAGVTVERSQFGPAVTAASRAAEGEANRSSRELQAEAQRAWQAEQNEMNRRTTLDAANIRSNAALRSSMLHQQIAASMRPLPANLANELTDITSALASIDEVETNLPTLEKLAGPFAGVGTRAAQYAGLTTKQEEQALSSLQGYFNTLAKARSGSAVTANELERLKAELPGLRQAPDQLRGRIIEQKRFWEQKLAAVHGLVPAAQRETATEAIRAAGIDPTRGTTVKMKTPDGRTWDVPRYKVTEAKQRGAVEVR